MIAIDLLKRMFFSPKRKVFFVLVCCLCVVIYISSQTLYHSSPTQIFRLLSLNCGMGCMIGFVFSYTIAVLLFVPAAALTLLAGGFFGLGWGIILVAIATSIADAIAFLASRYLARNAVERFAIRHPNFRAIDEAITKSGWRVIALLRLSPSIPYSASNYLYGLTGISFLPYLLTSALFTLPGTCVYVYLGYLGVETLSGAERSTAEWVLLVAGLITTIIATVYITVLVRRVINQATAD